MTADHVNSSAEAEEKFTPLDLNYLSTLGKEVCSYEVQVPVIATANTDHLT